MLWEKSGLNWGYWTQTDEEFFQKRLHEIYSGKANLRSATQWREGPIKFQRGTREVVKANREESARFIAHNFHRH